MSEPSYSFNLPPGITDAERRALVAKALAPLTPAEQEEYRANKVRDAAGLRLRAKLGEIAQSLRRWQRDAIASCVKKGLIPDHIAKASDPTTINLWMREQGYNFRGEGFHWELRKGEEVLSVFDVRLKSTDATA